MRLGGRTSERTEMVGGQAVRRGMERKGKRKENKKEERGHRDR